MTIQDKSIRCCDCGATFTFSASEQKFFESKNFISEPRRCMPCRRANKRRTGVSSSHSYSRR
jgi:hypothetical protein